MIWAVEPKAVKSLLISFEHDVKIDSTTHVYYIHFVTLKKRDITKFSSSNILVQPHTYLSTMKQEKNVGLT